MDLLDREGELADLYAFCADGDPFEWWQGPRGAGKTALAAWFALHPPPSIRVVSFFVIQRLAGESDSNGLTDSLFRQLAFLTGNPDAWSWPAEDRRRLLAPLLEAASSRLAEHGDRLLLVVDGLDEDQGGRPEGGPPSIASILPVRPPAGIRVLVTSLDQFDLPGDVDLGHPLRHCPRRVLTASPHARNEEAKARCELRGKLHNQQTREVIGLLTAAGGGELTVAELAGLAGLEEFTVGEIIDSLSRRILLTWERGYRNGEQVHPFRTEALYSAAQQLLGTDLER
ncbi:MAG: NACHT domain-containing protein [Streptosporangiaceae bacterium]